MDFKIDKSSSICPQICQYICLLITTNELSSNSKLESVRELAAKIGVNPNTVQKAFEQLEEKNIIYSVRGSGWYVSSEIDKAFEIVEQLRRQKTNFYIEEMKKLGINKENIILYIKERIGDDNE